ncbi:Mbov_0395 family pilin-like conjugal transfer protein [Mycoplasmopsis columbinasalis]|uniref:Uncharacterized protein n=1 Tax=Mycoplasmopsis columbinasalis TaxID=114880 RepID=A0A449BB18_9BACT|nr:pilin [Mycoplasmopsis columbinasalis]VEU78380.1 Uncharacterised protein [Mycoplasmopsis columbinasalis]
MNFITQLAETSPTETQKIGIETINKQAYSIGSQIWKFGAAFLGIGLVIAIGFIIYFALKLIMSNDQEHTEKYMRKIKISVLALGIVVGVLLIVSFIVPTVIELFSKSDPLSALNKSDKVS